MILLAIAAARPLRTVLGAVRVLRPTPRQLLAAVVLLALAAALRPAQAERVKDLATVQGVRANQLVGYSLVVGLDGTGDQTTQAPFTTQSLATMLQNLGIALPPGVNPQLRNTAAVMVTAQLPAFAQPGQPIDVTVSSIGNARSLRGGTLLMTPMKGADGNVYAIAQGNVVVGGAGASAAGSKVQINHLSAGRVPGGATVERTVPNAVLAGDVLHLELKTTDFTAATQVAEAINRRIGESTAQPIDARVIRVKLPPLDKRVAFVSILENIDVASATPPAKVIVNARTGSVVMNQTVTLAPSAVAHGNLSVSISTTPVVSQPSPFSQGSTVATEKADITIKQDGAALMMLEAGAKLSDVVKALNSLGATAQDLIAILQALKAAGSLKAELEII
ncbi:MAG: flagellar basal body P-ring protein FlgI [Burkholderiaceae bacterium]|jgi:flagellar P-ring protein precursor FlgI|nr:flagellar basal body P-ring protein FlgI [Burkholderiales bacterium]MCZ8339399.1 flagellar basal body P-ring protein FlgI [Burkholderiaceae bacterium]